MGGSTYTSVDIICLGTADNGDSGAGGGGGPFCFSKKESRQVIVRSVVLVFGDLVACELARLKHTGPTLPVKSNVKVNMAEGPSTATTPSTQFIHCEMQCVQPSCVQAHMESLRW